MDDLIVKEHLERLLSGHSKQKSKVLVFHEKNFRCISAKSIIFFYFENDAVEEKQFGLGFGVDPILNSLYYVPNHLNSHYHPGYLTTNKVKYKKIHQFFILFL